MGENVYHQSGFNEIIIASAKILMIMWLYSDEKHIVKLDLNYSSRI